jgi:flagellar assembly factor FliW
MPQAETRHGTIHYEEDQVFEMLGGLLGFPDAKRFVLLESADIEPLRWLVSVDRKDLSVLVIDPRLLVPGYRVELSREEQSKLEITDGEVEREGDGNILPLAITLLSDKPQQSTANLKAPIVLNTARMVAAQIVQTESRHSVQHPLLAEVPG